MRNGKLRERFMIVSLGTGRRIAKSLDDPPRADAREWRGAPSSLKFSPAPPSRSHPCPFLLNFSPSCCSNKSGDRHAEKNYNLHRGPQMPDTTLREWTARFQREHLHRAAQDG